MKYIHSYISRSPVDANPLGQVKLNFILLRTHAHTCVGSFWRLFVWLSRLGQRKIKCAFL